MFSFWARSLLSEAAIRLVKSLKTNGPSFSVDGDLPPQPTRDTVPTTNLPLLLTQMNYRPRRYTETRRPHVRRSTGLSWLIGNRHAGTSLASQMTRRYANPSFVAQRFSWLIDENQQREREQGVIPIYNGTVIHRCPSCNASLHRPLLSLRPVFLPILERIAPQLVQAVLPDFRGRRHSNRWAMYGAMSTGLNWLSNDTVVLLNCPSTPRVNLAEPLLHEFSLDVPPPTQRDSQERRYSGLRELHARHSRGLNWLSDESQQREGEQDVISLCRDSVIHRCHPGSMTLHSPLLSMHPLRLPISSPIHTAPHDPNVSHRLYESNRGGVGVQFQSASDPPVRPETNLARPQPPRSWLEITASLISNAQAQIRALYSLFRDRPSNETVMSSNRPTISRVALTESLLHESSQDVPPPSQTDSRETSVSVLVTPQPADSWMERIARLISRALAKIRAVYSLLTDVFPRNISHTRGLHLVFSPSATRRMHVSPAGEGVELVFPTEETQLLVLFTKSGRCVPISFLKPERKMFLLFDLDYLELVLFFPESRSEVVLNFSETEDCLFYFPLSGLELQLHYHEPWQPLSRLCRRILSRISNCLRHVLWQLLSRLCRQILSMILISLLLLFIALFCLILFLKKLFSLFFDIFCFLSHIYDLI